MSRADCTRCPAGSVTLNLGETKPEACMCDPASYRTSGDVATGDIKCTSCPQVNSQPIELKSCVRCHQDACDGDSCMGERVFVVVWSVRANLGQQLRKSWSGVAGGVVFGRKLRIPHQHDVRRHRKDRWHVGARRQRGLFPKELPTRLQLAERNCWDVCIRGSAVQKVSDHAVHHLSQLSGAVSFFFVCFFFFFSSLILQPGRPRSARLDH